MSKEDDKNTIPGGKSYIDPTIFGDMKFLENDIVVTCGAKNGTNWTMFLSHLLANDGDASFECLYRVVPWIEFVEYPGQDPKERVDRWLDSNWWQSSRRIFKSHMPTPPLPFEEKVKYIVTVRNPRDAAISFAKFIGRHNPEFLKIWGIEGIQQHLNSIEAAADDEMEKRRAATLVKSWYALRHKSNVLLLHFENLKKDLAGEVNKLYDFLQIKSDKYSKQELVEKVCALASFDWMKKHEEKFEARCLAPKDPDSGKPIYILQPGAMMRKGGSGEWKSSYSKEYIEKWENFEKEMYPDDDQRHWVKFGGDLPK